MPEKEYRQTSLFSATFPPLVQSLAKAFLREYVWIGIGRVGSTVQNITQKIVRATLDPQVKLKLLLEAIPQTDGRTLVFVRRKQTASELTNILRREYRIPVDEIHGKSIDLILFYFIFTLHTPILIDGHILYI